MLFGKKKKQKSKEIAPSFTTSVPYSKNFKGFKRIKLSTYNDPLVDLELIRAMPDPAEVIFEEYLYPDVSPLFRVSAAGVRLGTMWKNELNQEYYDLIRSGKCKKVSLGLNATDVFIFIK